MPANAGYFSAVFLFAYGTMSVYAMAPITMSSLSGRELLKWCCSGVESGRADEAI